MYFCYHCQRLLALITDPIRIQKMLKIYNSLSNQKEVFTPITENKIKMYVCGMTVYDYCHLGHARVMVAFDVVYRYLNSKGL